MDDHIKGKASVREGLSPLQTERRNEQTAQSGRFRTTRQDFATFLYAEQLGIFFWVSECAKRHVIDDVAITNTKSRG